MGVREHKVECYLDKQILNLGGITRKWISPGRDGVPDRIVILRGVIWFVEIKTTVGVLSICQEREHDRLRKAGANVTTLAGVDEVDEFIKGLTL